MNKMMGEILVEVGIISRTTLERALERQQGTDLRLGAVLEEMGVVTEEEIVEVLSKQLSVRMVKNILGHQFDPELFRIVPAVLAVEHTIFPLRLRDNILAVAISDPQAVVEIVDLLSRKTGYKVMPILAPTREICNAIKQYYLGGGEQAGELEKRILVVEDSPVVANVVKAALEREGFAVIQAMDGLEGLKAAITTKPRVIICDAIMPRMDGYAFMRALAAQTDTADIPVILLTSKASPEEEQKALSSGFFDFIAKPVNAVRVVSRVRRAIEITGAKKR